MRTSVLVVVSECIPEEPRIEKINHPILQDNYKLVLILKQCRWRCTNPDCLYDISDSFKFVSKNRRTTNATDMLIVDAYRNLAESSASISKKIPCVGYICA